MAHLRAAAKAGRRAAFLLKGFAHLTDPSADPDWQRRSCLEALHQALHPRRRAEVTWGGRATDEAGDHLQCLALDLVSRVWFHDALGRRPDEVQMREASAALEAAAGVRAWAASALALEAACSDAPQRADEATKPIEAWLHAARAFPERVTASDLPAFGELVKTVLALWPEGARGPERTTWAALFAGAASGINGGEGEWPLHPHNPSPAVAGRLWAAGHRMYALAVVKEHAVGCLRALQKQQRLAKLSKLAPPPLLPPVPGAAQLEQARGTRLARLLRVSCECLGAILGGGKPEELTQAAQRLLPFRGAMLQGPPPADELFWVGEETCRALEEAAAQAAAPEERDALLRLSNEVVPKHAAEARGAEAQEPAAPPGQSSVALRLKSKLEKKRRSARAGSGSDTGGAAPSEEEERARSERYLQFLKELELEEAAKAQRKQQRKQQGGGDAGRPPQPQQAKIGRAHV